ncbi:DUF1963 domain-containing protein [Rhizobiales bacterium RZME27]|jgi:uncharacterized protein YwqG|uniref:DUF1963 domain-containing protein n=1 Tax=Endobacterium cereale TaxID=2663029 RepID=A0A6A8ADW2_9HYPH|nr:YwqG family protein [Endobacterium cereale]MQY49505.1 DUF1963 domain-containing protein [Endobacterium cereale]
MSRRFHLALAGSLFACVSMMIPHAVLAQEQDEVMALPSSRDELSDRLTEAGMSAAGVEAIIKVARDGIVLDTKASDEATLAPGASKVGGLPDLPKGVEWPVRPAYDSAETLAAQFNADAANLYGDAGIAPPWMPEAEGKAFVAERKRANDEVKASTLKIMKDAGAEIDEKDLEGMTGLPPDAAAKAAAEQRMLAEIVAKPYPLPFIAQVDLAAMAKEPGFDKVLPVTGRLLFFYDMPVLPASYEPRGKAGWKVIYDDTPVADLERKPLPKELADFPGTASLKAAAMTPRSVVTTVPVGDSGWDVVGEINGDDVSTYSGWLFSLGWPTAIEGGNHQLGGWPRAIQSGMQAMSQFASNGLDAGSGEAFQTDEGKRLLAGGKDWHLVLQIGTDEATGYPFPGALYVLMREEDLAARNFEKAWVVYEQD